MIEITDSREVESGKCELNLATHEDTAYANELQLPPLKTYRFGTNADGVIEAVCKTKDEGVVEIGYYFGDAKQKNIIKISSQIGCPARCNFCEVGEEVWRRNLSASELVAQYEFMNDLVRSNQIGDISKQQKINIAGTGDVMFNTALVDALEDLRVYAPSIKVCTVFPDTQKAWSNFKALASFAGTYSETIQIQISLVSTDETYRKKAIGINVLPINDLVVLSKLWRAFNPRRSQINLSLILTEDVPVDVQAVRHILHPDNFRFRFREYVPTAHGFQQDVKPISAERLSLIKKEFAAAGYYVGDEASPTETERKFSLASNVSRRRALGN